MAIPSLDAWLLSTAPEQTSGGLLGVVRGLAVSRGSNMVLIDIALANWHQYGPGSRSAEVKVPLLYELKKQCKHWLKKKAPKPGQVAKNTPLFAKRKFAVDNLVTEVNAEIAGMTSGLAQALLRLDQAKATGGRMGTMAITPKNLQPKALDRTYVVERQHYLAKDKKDHPIAASYAHNVFEAYKEGGGGDSVKTGVGDVKSVVKGKADFSEISLKDYEKLAKAMTENTQVVYLNKVRRLKLLAVPDDQDGLIYNIDDNPINMRENFTRGGKTFRMAGLYAMDRYGNLFLCDQLPKYGEINYFNHSSFNAGREVLSAGCIQIGGNTPGKLNYIDNKSGHYKPTKIDLQNALKVLVAQGVDITNTCVTAQGDAGDHKATTYINDVNAAPDWPAAGEGFSTP